MKHELIGIFQGTVQKVHPNPGLPKMRWFYQCTCTYVGDGWITVAGAKRAFDKHQKKHS